MTIPKVQPSKDHKDLGKALAGPAFSKKKGK